MTQKTYIFIEQEDYKELKEAVARLQTKPPERKPEISNANLWFSFGSLIAGFLAMSILDSTEGQITAFITAIVFAQISIDIYKGEHRQRWSAAFRALALVGWLAIQAIR